MMNDFYDILNKAQMLENFEKRFVNQKVQVYEPWSSSYLEMGTIQNTFLCERRNNSSIT